jgi:hypothetical protein
MQPGLHARENLKIMWRIILCFGALLPALLFAQADPPAALHNLELRVWLKQNWYDGMFTDLGYSPARIQMYSYTDEVNGQIACVYTGFEQAAEAVTFPDPINAEHLVPQSFFGSLPPMRSDLYNLRPAHGSANSARSNFVFGECADNLAQWYGVNAQGGYFSTTTQPAGSDSFSERVGSVWEPREENKGDIARQLFYFYTIYPTEAGAFSLLADINVLYAWHLNDPVDAKEMLRTQRVAEVQGNLNPYVLYADLVHNAWFWEAVLGCTEAAALNYSPAANTDDGSCLFGPIPGCTYAVAINYNPLANDDDGSCLFVSAGLQGCTYANATNYAPEATVDNGSCVFAENGCISDLNSDGTVDVSDFLIFLGDFNQPCPN